MNVLPIFLAMGFAWAFGKRFRVFSLVALGTAIAFGAVASMQAGQLDANEPTPWHGVYERINIGAYLLWMDDSSRHDLSHSQGVARDTDWLDGRGALVRPSGHLRASSERGSFEALRLIGFFLHRETRGRV